MSSRLRILLALVLGYALVVLVFAALQRFLLYFPTRFTEAQAQTFAASRGLEPLPSARGDRLGFRHLPDGTPGATLLVAHGNAGSALDREHFIDLAAGRDRSFEVILVEYPGYGSRSGTPTEEANVGAMVEAIDRSRAAGRPIVLLGESLGSAVACLAAARRPDDVAAVVLITPLPRLALVAAHHYPLIPTFLLSDRYEADAALARWGGPAAFVVAAEDEVIPASLAVAMHAAYRGPKLLEVDSRATHNTIDYDPSNELWSRVFAFVERALP